MEELVRKRDFEGLKNYFANCRESVSEEDFSSLLEVRLRERGLDIARGPDETIEENVRRHLEFALNVCKNGLCVKQTAVQTLQDMFEVSGIGRCERLFGILEENMFQFKQSPLVESSQTQILRMCNDLLKRLSRSAETSFCGRILFFLSRYLPLGEKSGLNLMGHFNTQNITKFDTTESQPVDLINGSDEEIETGEIKEAKEINIPVDHALYSMFWQMQDFFSNPMLCFDKQHWDNSADVLGVFSSYKLEKSGDDDDENGRKRSAMPENLHELIDEADSYFAKYLTSPKIWRTFRKNTSLTDDQLKYVNESQEKCYRLLRETHPKGAQFAENVKHILQRELEWAKWKSESCPAMTDLADKQPMQPYKKRPRTTFNPAVVDVGSTELNKLWSIQPNLLEACKNEKRKFAPSLAEFLRDPIDELDPEQQVEDQYK
ncbi:hypothetical protein ANCDUO_16676 [Ancylostoma duodenale]|uniref:Uncharacterized protein n=1 Tax=Ancylostoma duodenale TaxID=51022 RepID=A0A0C2G2U1_9BILA|nr:hypothetical protein ANCDUO_16676 [Ancylostoma duodenale]